MEVSCARVLPANEYISNKYMWRSQKDKIWLGWLKRYDDLKETNLIQWDHENAPNHRNVLQLPINRPFLIMKKEYIP